MTNAADLAAVVLDALDRLDQRDAPHGLYAGHDRETTHPADELYREWSVALRPALGAAGATDLFARPPFEQISFTLAPLGSCELVLRRLAKIKVRRFGSVYRVDDRVDYSERWRRVDLPALLNGLRYPATSRARRFAMVTLIGFAREQHPFHEELDLLVKETRGLEVVQRTWLDRYGRAFSVGLTAWWAPPAEVAA